MTEKQKTETKKAKAKKAAKTGDTPIEVTLPKAEKPKVEKPPREDRSAWGTLAIRLPIHEREAFHQAAGSAAASRTLRALASAFVDENEAAFKNAIAEAKTLRP